MSGEKDLWAAVLDRAIEDLRSDKEHHSAMYWIGNRKNTGVGSFLWVCDTLGFDADKTRDKILYNNRIHSDRQQKAAGVR